MSKDEAVAKMAKDANISKAAADKALRSLLDGITSSLKKGKKVAFVGFGTFATAKRKARTGRNPRTGATIKIAAARVPRFKPGKALKDAVRT
jgi:DNA-binding protein HU-beta